MQSRSFMPVNVLGLLGISGLLGACSPVYVADIKPPITDQPFLGDNYCQCPVSALSMQQARTDLQAVYFNTASSRLRPEAQRKLDAIANAIRFNNPTSVVIEGNADSRGKNRYNRNLAQRRANKVRRALISRGIASDLLVIQSNGENRPVAPNNNRQGQQMNRRVDVTLYLR